MTGLYQKRRLSPVEVAQACLKQVLKYNPALNAICHMDEKAALHQARASERRWKEGQAKSAIDGIPVTVKDWFNIKGWPTRQGSQITSAAPQPNDSLCVTNLRDAGSVFIGKTTLPEFGHKGVCHSPLHGITRNPWNLDKTSGGSSGGAAVAAATGMGLLNLGSDAGGSVRIPAAFSGVVGFKPSPGLMPGWPPSLFSSMSSIGPMTRSVQDAALMMDALAARHDSMDFNSLPLPAPRFAEALKAPCPRLRVAVVTEINGMGMTPDLRKVWNAQKKHFAVLGDVEEITLKVPRLAETFAGHWTAVASYIARSFSAAQRKAADARFMHWVERGDRQHLHDYLGAEYDRLLIGGQFKDLLTTYDVLLTPATPFAAFDVGIDMPDDDKGNPVLDWNIFNAFANLARLPAASIPLGLTADGLPAGLQVCAGYLRDALLLQACRKLEEAIGFTPWLANETPKARRAG